MLVSHQWMVLKTERTAAGFKIFILKHVQSGIHVQKISHNQGVGKLDFFTADKPLSYDKIAQGVAINCGEI